MLTIHRLTRDRSSYYLSDLSLELPASSVTQQWVGQSSALLGLRGQVDATRLGAVLEGRQPATGSRLRSEQASVLAYDLTFSAPKSVSVLFALGGLAEVGAIVEGHAQAVTAAVGYLEEHALGAVRSRDHERAVVASDGMVAGAFCHGLSRNRDPHLHTHVVMANLVHGQDGRWSACDQRGLWAHRSAASAVYESHLRVELAQRLGVRWSDHPLRSAEIEGLSPVLLGEFSSRAADIRRHAFEAGVHSGRGRQIAWAATRPAKGEGAAFDVMAAEWSERASAALQAVPDLGPLLGRRRPEAAVLSEHRFAGEISVTSPRGVRRRDVVTALARAAPDGASADTIGTLTDMWLPSTKEEVGVAEGTQSRRSVLPATHVVRALGARPLDPALHQVWRDTARTIEDYRTRWSVGPTTPPLGDAACRPDWPTARLADHLRATNVIEEARARLGRREPLQVELGRGR